MEIIKGYIGHFVYANEETGYHVFELIDDDGENITVTGILRGFSEGETVEIDGEYTVHPLYGRQFKIASVKALPPESKTAVLRYLGSGAIKGVGEALAGRIVKKFGDDTLRIATEEPERLAEVKGISLKKAYEIGEQIAEKKDLRDAMMFLQSYGISQNLAGKIFNRYRNELYNIIRDNPYRLAEDIDGVGFKTADEIAAKSGISSDSEYRIRSGIIYVLLKTTQEGNCFYPLEDLINETAETLGTDEDAVREQISDLVLNRKIIIKNDNDCKKVYYKTYYYEEQNCARKMLELKNSYDAEDFLCDDRVILKRIEQVEKSENIELDDLQRKAVLHCMKEGVFILTGGPGTGKTTTLNTIIALFEQVGTGFCLAAPTGRAAKRMQETTGYEAKTIHRLLEINGNPENDNYKSGYFERNEDNPLDVEVVIVDEMSMVDIHLFNALLNAIVPGTKLILVGDSFQLHSVGPGQVLKDLIASNAFAAVCLEKVFRQDEDSHIVTNAYKINRGEKPDFSKKYRDFFLLEKDDPEIIYSYITSLMLVNVPKEFQIDPFEVQVLSPMRKGNLGTVVLNRVLQEKMNPPSKDKKEYLFGDVIFREGDKIMQIRNNYELEWEVVGKYNMPIDSGKGIFNGDVGIIEKISDESRVFNVKFDDENTVLYSYDDIGDIEHAYAVTVHKSQGSEYPVVIIPVLSGPRQLFTRNLLYTAVTRAKKSVILIGSESQVRLMIDTDVIQKRYTSLANRITELINTEKETDA